MSSARLAQAVNHASRRHASRAKNAVLGEVVNTSPLKIRLIEEAVTLTDDDFALTAWLACYDAEYDLAKGDTILLLREANDYVAFDVIPDVTPDFDQAFTVRTRFELLEERVAALEGA